MIARKDILREESKTDDRAIRDFRKKMDEHKTAAVRQRSAVSVLSGLCSVLAVMVLAGGVAMFNNYKRLHEMEQVVASVDPEAVIREARGNLSSVAGNRTTGETPVEVIPETMAPGGSTAGTVEASLTNSPDNIRTGTDDCRPDHPGPGSQCRGFLQSICSRRRGNAVRDLF